MTLKLAQFCDDPQKISTNLHTLKKIHLSENPQKILKFRILNPPPKKKKKIAPAYACVKISEYPPPPGSWVRYGT